MTLAKVEYSGDCPSLLGGWVGGKFYLSRKIVALIPAHHCYCEPFCGAAWVFFRKTPSPVEVLNDRNGEVVNLFRVLREQPEELARLWSLTPHSREEFFRLLEADASDWPAAKRAWRFLSLQKSAWACKQGSPFFKTSSHRSNGTRHIACDQRIWDCAQRLRRATLENLDWRHILDLYDHGHTFFYMDPPYYGAESYYGDLFGPDDLADLAQRLQKISGKFLLSINDCDFTRDLFGKFHILDNPDVRYPIAAMYVASNRRKKELLIANYQPQRLPQGE